MDTKDYLSVYFSHIDPTVTCQLNLQSTKMLNFKVHSNKTSH